MKKFLVIAVAVLLLWGPFVSAQDGPVRSIENVTGDLYLFRENNTNGVFLVTDEGIILADPISHDNAVWLKGQLAERFGVPVKYVIYSHDHADHTSGGEVFADTATFVAHENATEKIAASGHTPVPDEVFSSRLNITLGGKVVVLNHYYQPSHSDNLTGVFFPGEKALFLVDIVGVKRLPYRDLRDFNFQGVIGSLTFYTFKDLRILIPGHGVTGQKDDLVDFRTYLLDLLREGLKAKQNGLSLAEAQEKLLLPEYREWDQYETWREQNITGVYRAVEEQGLLKDFNDHRLFFPFLKYNPIYPSQAARKNLCGWVVVQYDIGEKGETKNIEVVNTSGTEIFNAAAIAAVKKNRYAPGFPAYEAKTRISFELEGVCQAPPLSGDETVK